MPKERGSRRRTTDSFDRVGGQNLLQIDPIQEGIGYFCPLGSDSEKSDENVNESARSAGIPNECGWIAENPDRLIQRAATLEIFPSRKRRWSIGKSHLLQEVQNGNATSFLTAIKATRNAIEATKVAEQLTRKDEDGVTVLMHSAQRGSLPLFSATLDALRHSLTTLQVLAELAARSRDGRTLLMFAAKGGSLEVFKALMKAMLQESKKRVMQLANRGVPTLYAPTPDGSGTQDPNPSTIRLTHQCLVAQCLVAAAPEPQTGSSHIRGSQHGTFPAQEGDGAGGVVNVFAWHSMSSTAVAAGRSRGGGEVNRQGRGSLAVSMSSPGAGNYFEVTVVNPGVGTFISVGVADPESFSPGLEEYPGSSWHSYGYRGDEGGLFGGHSRPEQTWEYWVQGDVIGCGFDLERMAIWYTRNGELLGDGFTNVNEMRLVPVIGLKRGSNSVVRVNFGTSTFLYQGPGVVEAPAVVQERARMQEEAQRRGEDIAALTCDATSELTARDAGGVSFLMHAARSHDPAIFVEALGAMKRAHSQAKVIRELCCKSNDGLSLVEHALQGQGGAPMCAAVNRAMMDAAQSVSEKDDNNMGLLMRVASTSNPGEFCSTLEALRQLITEKEVGLELVAKARNDQTLLMMTARLRTPDAFSSALGAMKEILTPSQVVEQLLEKDAGKRTLLMYATNSGSLDKTEGESFGALIDTVNRMPIPESTEQSQMSPDSPAAGIAGERPPIRPVDYSRASIPDVLIMTGCTDFYRRTQTSLFDMIMRREGSGGETLARYELSARGDSFDTFVKVLNTVKGGLLSPSQVVDQILAKDDRGQTLLTFAARHRHIEVISAVLTMIEEAVAVNKLSEKQVKGLLMDRDLVLGQTILMHATDSGTPEVFSAVLGSLKDVLTPDQVIELLSKRDSVMRTLLMHATDSSSSDMFSTVLESLKEHLTETQLATELISADSGNMTVLMYIARQGEGSEESMEMIVNELRRLRECGELSFETVVHFLHMRTKSDATTAIMLAAKHGTVGACSTLLEFAAVSGCDLDATSASHEKFKSAIHMAADRRDRSFLDMVATLIRHGAVPASQTIIALIRRAHNEGTLSEDRLVNSLVGAVASARNPLIPGMNMSKALGDAALRGPETRNMVAHLRQSLEELNRRVLSQLPPTVRSTTGGNAEIERGMVLVGSILEPEKGGKSHHKLFTGPLQTALEAEHHQFFSTPLVLDFLSLKFDAGLPSNLGGWSAPDDQEMGYLRSGNLVVTGNSWFGPEVLQGKGADADIRSLTVLPGAQFILAGMAANSMAFFAVPASRMAFEFVVSLVMVIIFTANVALDEGAVGVAEIIFHVFIVGSVLIEVQQARQSHTRSYYSDRWNMVDFALLSLLSVGLLFRMVTIVEGNTSGELNTWDNLFLAQFFFALSAPVLFSRLLFYIQIFPAQGPLIQVIFGMLRLLISFSVLLLVIILGFAVAFQSLFRNDVCMPSFHEFDTSLITLFQAMLADFNVDGFFEGTVDCPVDNVELCCNGSPHGYVGIALMVAYVTLMAICLLNLLIAVLSTAHANVQENAEREFAVTRAAIIIHYAHEVENNMLPAPFNILQEGVSSLVMSYSWVKAKLCRECCFREQEHEEYLPLHLGEIRRRTNKLMGKVSFWLVMGPLAIAAVAVLWAISIPKGMYAVWKIWGRPGLSKAGHFQNEKRSYAQKAYFSATILGLFAGGAPLLLAFKWLKCLFQRDELGVFSESPAGDNKKDSHSGVNYTDHTATFFPARQTKELTEGVKKQGREETSKAATIRDVRLLKDHLNGRMEGMQASMVSIERKIEASIDLLRRELLGEMKRALASPALGSPDSVG